MCLTEEDYYEDDEEDDPDALKDPLYQVDLQVRAQEPGRPHLFVLRPWAELLACWGQGHGVGWALLRVLYHNVVTLFKIIFS